MNVFTITLDTVDPLDVEFQEYLNVNGIKWNVVASDSRMYIVRYVAGTREQLIDMYTTWFYTGDVDHDVEIINTIVEEEL